MSPVPRPRYALVSSEQWVDYFTRQPQDEEQYRTHPDSALTPQERALIKSSLQEFQLGESGEGKHLFKCANAWADKSGDTAYLTALHLFIAEEQRHSRYLKIVMDSAGIPAITKSASDGIFRWLRHRAGLELSIAVLVTAEVIAQIYYAALRHATASGHLRAICTRILKDEAQHVRFQCQRLAILRAARSQLLNILCQRLHQIFFLITCLVVWLRHGRAMRAGGYGFWRFLRCGRQKMHHAAELMNPAHYAISPPAPTPSTPLAAQNLPEPTPFFD